MNYPRPACLFLLLPFQLLTAQTWPTYTPTVLADLATGSATSDPGDLTVFQDRIWFTAWTPQYGRELYVTDGTTAGTQLFVDLSPGTGNSQIDNLCVLGDRLFFSAHSPGTGRELWSTDGTVPGTQLFADLEPGNPGSSPQQLTRIGDRIFFSAADGAGREPWVTDGTLAGTYRIADLAPGSASSSPQEFCGYPGHVVFRADDGSGIGAELFHTDGTAVGTFLLKDIHAGTWSSFPQEMLAFDGLVYFSAFTPLYGHELWRTDFTTAGTVLFQDLSPGPPSSGPAHLQPMYDGRGFFFYAHKPGHGYDLISTDGNTVSWLWPAGVGMTSVVPTINLQAVQLVGSRKLYLQASTPGANSELHIIDLTDPNPFGLFAFDLNPTNYSDPREFTTLRDLVVFAATDANLGRELWVMPNGATEHPLDPGCSGSRLDVIDPVLGSTIYYYIDTDVPSAATIAMVGFPLPIPLPLPWLSSCPVRVDPTTAVTMFTPSPAIGGFFGFPADPALHGLTLVMQAFVGSTTVSTSYDLTNAVRLHLGL